MHIQIVHVFVCECVCDQMFMMYGPELFHTVAQEVTFFKPVL